MQDLAAEEVLALLVYIDAIQTNIGNALNDYLEQRCSGRQVTVTRSLDLAYKLCIEARHRHKDKEKI